MSGSKVTVTQRGGVGVLGLLGVVFVVLKLGGWTEVATWSWWFVLMPFWIGWAILLGFFAAAGAGALLILFGAWCIDLWNARKYRKRLQRKGTP
jgi:hypothetical protein